jgi:hypothetical protein
MRRGVFSSAIFAVCFAATLLADARGQSSSPSQPPDSSAQPAAQRDSSGNSAPAKSANPKKVWTEDDLNSLKSHVSVVGAPSKSPKTSPKPPQDNQAAESLPPEKDPAWYRQQLPPLRAQIEEMDAQIRKLKEAQGGKETSDAGRRYGLHLPMNTQDRIEVLEKTKRELQAKVDALEDQARRNGLNPGDLRQ